MKTHEWNVVGQRAVCAVCGHRVKFCDSVTLDSLSSLGACPGDREPSSDEFVQEQVAFRLSLVRSSAISSIESYADLNPGTFVENCTANLDACLSPCDKFSGTCCRRISGTCATKYPKWIEVIVTGACEKFKTTNVGDGPQEKSDG